MAVQPGFCRTWLETLKTGFLEMWLKCQGYFIDKDQKAAEMVVLTRDDIKPLKAAILLFKIVYMSLVVRKQAFCICQNKDVVQLVTAKLISAFVFATRIVQYLFFLKS